MPAASVTLDAALAALAENRPLPGDAARASMLPEYRRDPSPTPIPDPETWKDAAVLILLYPDAGQVRFPLMLRPSGTGVHSGQISLPGGSRECGEDPEACALRETYEELGVDPSQVRVIRKLSPLRILPSSFLVQPYVGVQKSRPAFRPAPEEVVDIFEIPLDDILDPGTRAEDVMEFRGRSWRVPFYRLAGQRVWGATALILAELEALLRGTAAQTGFSMDA